MSQPKEAPMMKSIAGSSSTWKNTTPMEARSVNTGPQTLKSTNKFSDDDIKEETALVPKEASPDPK